MKNIQTNKKMVDSNSSETIVITKVVLDFDDALFPSHQYRQHGMLKYHEFSSKESVETGRDIFKNEKEPMFQTLKQKIDLVIFKLMQLYNKDNFVILSTGNYEWVQSTLKHYGYLLAAYNTQIYSTQKWIAEHPNDFNLSNSLEAKSFLIRMLLKKWKQEALQKHKVTSHNKVIKFRLISIGDSFFEFLACYKCGFDHVSRIKMLEEPTVNQMINLWERILFLCQQKALDQNVVFLSDKECYYLSADRMYTLNQQCVDRVNNKNNVVRQSLFDIITLHNSEYYEIAKDQNGKWHKKRIIQKKTKTVQTMKTSNDSSSLPTNQQYDMANYHYQMNYHYPTQTQTQSQGQNQLFYQQQQCIYAHAQYQQLWHQQQNQIQSQYVYNHYVCCNVVLCMYTQCTKCSLLVECVIFYLDCSTIFAICESIYSSN